MKPAQFDYARPSDVNEACAMLAAGDDARIIAGGQSLVPLMAMRLARPKRLIDIARISELAFVRHEHECVAIGAATRQSVLERDPIIRAAVPLLAKVMPFIGHAAIRSRGTIGGSLANADPAAEMALVAVTLGATLVYRDGPASAEIAASDFFVGPMTTALPATACLTAVRFPVCAMRVSALVFTRSVHGAAISHWPRPRRRWRSTRTASAGGSHWGWGRWRGVRW